MALYADDLHAGQRFELGSYTLTEPEILEFARQWDPLTIHTDPDAAAKTPLGGVIASGLQTLAVYQRLAVAAFWNQFNGGIGRGFELQFRRPVKPGTTLSGAITVESVTPREGRGDAEVEISAELTNDKGAVVLALTNYSVLPLRGDATD